MFWAALSLGRLVAIPLAVYLSTTTMMRIQLSLSVIGVGLFAGAAHKSYSLAVGSAVVFGYALSSLFPLGMTIVGDYGFTMYVHFQVN